MSGKTEEENDSESKRYRLGSAFAESLRESVSYDDAIQVKGKTPQCFTLCVERYWLSRTGLPQPVQVSVQWPYGQSIHPPYRRMIDVAVTQILRQLSGARCQRDSCVSAENIRLAGPPLQSTQKGIELIAEENEVLSKTAEYALRAVVWLARTELPVTADQLSEGTQIPRRYAHTVLQQLRKNGLVESQSGPGGGYCLARSAADTSVLDVVNAVDPLERFHSCPLGDVSHKTLCPLHRELDQFAAAAERSMSKVTLLQLLDNRRGDAPLCQVEKL